MFKSAVPSLRAGVILAGATLTLALPAHADSGPLTPAQQHSLDQAIGLWSTGLVGGDHGAPYSVTPEDDHYRIEISANGQLGPRGGRIEGGKVTASATMLDGGRWAFDKLTYPAALRFVPAPNKDGSPAGAVAIAMQAATRSSHVVIDPSLATISSFDSASTGLTLSVALDKTTLDLKADKATSHAAWEPAGAGRVNALSATALDGLAYDIQNLKPGTSDMRIAVRHLSSETHGAGYAPDQLADAVRSFLLMVETPPEKAAADAKTNADGNTPAMPPPAVVPPPAAGAATTVPELKPKLSAAQRAALHGAIDALRGAFDSLGQTATADGVTITTSGHEVSFDKVSISQSVAGPGGKADLKIRLALDGIAIPGLPPGVFQTLMPHHLVLAPHISGMPVADLFALVSKGIDDDGSKGKQLGPDGMTALAKAPINVGLDELSLDLGPSKLTASGTFHSAGPQDVDGSADIKATGLDDLIKLASTDPMLGQGAPVLIFLKGIGEQNGAVVTWKVAYVNHKLTVNGADMSNLVPHR